MHNILRKMDTSSWENWKASLGQAVEFAEELGIPRETIAELAHKFGSYLAGSVDASVSENRALKELWNVATPEEQKVLAGLVTKLVTKH